MANVIDHSMWWQRRATRMALVALVAAISFAPALKGGFISDDGYMILNRANYLQSNSGLLELVSNVYWWGTDLPQARQQLYRPWIALTYWVEYQISGDSPLVYHLSNYLVHLANAILLLLLLETVTGIGATTFVTLLFAVSPTAITSVGWIAGRTDLWALLFSLLFLILLRRYRAKGGLAAAIGAALSLFLALCSKEIAILAPVIWRLLEHVRPSQSAGDSVKRNPAVTVATMALPLIVYFLLRQTRPVAEAATVLAGNSGFFSELPYLAERYVRTVFHTLIPTGYSFYSEFDWSLTSQRGIAFVAAWIILITMAVLLVWGIRRRQLWAAGGAWFGLVLFVPYSFGQSWAPIADFYAYAGLPGLWILILDGAVTLSRRFKRELDFDSPRLLIGTGAMTIVYAVLVFVRLPILASDFSLTSHMVAREPRSSRALVGLGDNYRLSGDLVHAAELYQRAVQVDSSSIEPRLRLSKLYLGAGDPDRAAPLVQTLLELAPGNPEVQAIAGRWFYEIGDFQKAAVAFQKAFAQSEPGSEALFDFGMVLMRLQKYREAGTVYQEVLKRKPRWSAAHSNLGLCYESLGLFDSAVAAYLKALELDPASVEVNASLAFVYSQMGNRDLAAQYAQTYAAAAPPGERTERFIADLVQLGLLAR